MSKSENMIYKNTTKKVNKIYNETKDVNKVIDIINFEINNCCLENNLSLKLVFKLVQLRNAPPLISFKPTPSSTRSRAKHDQKA